MRKDSAVHVSLSSYSLVKQPGTVAVPLPGGPESRRSLKPPTEIGSFITIVVRSFEGAQSHRKADGAPYGGYIVAGMPECQHLSPKASGFSHCSVKPIVQSQRRYQQRKRGRKCPRLAPFRARGAALGPHSSNLLCLAGGVRSGDSAQASHAQATAACFPV